MSPTDVAVYAGMGAHAGTIALLSRKLSSLLSSEASLPEIAPAVARLHFDCTKLEAELAGVPWLRRCGAHLPRQRSKPKQLAPLTASARSFATLRRIVEISIKNVTDAVAATWKHVLAVLLHASRSQARFAWESTVSQAVPVLTSLCGIHGSILGPSNAPITESFLEISLRRAHWAAVDGSHEAERQILDTLQHSIPSTTGRSTVNHAISFAVMHEHASDALNQSTLAAYCAAGSVSSSPNTRWLDGVFVKWATAIGPTALQQHKDRLGIPLSHTGPPGAPHTSDMLGKSGQAFAEILHCLCRIGPHAQYFLQHCARIACDVITTALSQRAQAGVEALSWDGGKSTDWLRQIMRLCLLHSDTERIMGHLLQLQGAVKWDWLVEEAFHLQLSANLLSAIAVDWTRQVADVVCQHCFDVPSKAAVAAIKRSGRKVRISNASVAAGYGKSAPALVTSVDNWVYATRKLVVRQEPGPALDGAKFAELLRAGDPFVATCATVECFVRVSDSRLPHHRVQSSVLYPGHHCSSSSHHNASVYAVGPSACMIQAMTSFVLAVVRPLGRLSRPTQHRFGAVAVAALLRYLEAYIRAVRWQRDLQLTQLGSVQLHADLAYFKLWFASGCPTVDGYPSDSIPCNIYDLFTAKTAGNTALSPEICQAILAEPTVRHRFLRFHCFLLHVIGTPDAVNVRRMSLNSTAIMPEAVPSATDTFGIHRLTDADAWLELITYSDRALFKKFVDSEKHRKRQPLAIVLS